MAEMGLDNRDAPVGVTVGLDDSGRPSGLWLVAFKGYPGSGKSTVARAVSRRLGWPLIDKDDVKDLLDGHTPEAGALAYNVMFNVARRQLSQGLSVICDSPLTHRKGYEHAARIAEQMGAALAVVECRCPDDALWRQRIEARQALGLPAHHKTDWTSLQDHLRTAKSDASYSIVHPYLVVYTIAPVAESRDRVIEWLTQHDDTAGGDAHSAE